MISTPEGYFEFLNIFTKKLQFDINSIELTNLKISYKSSLLSNLISNYTLENEEYTFQCLKILFKFGATFNSKENKNISISNKNRNLIKFLVANGYPVKNPK